MVFSLKIDYSGLDFTSKSKLRYKVFGRIVKRKKDCYYYAGLLDLTKHARVGKDLFVLETPVVVPDELKERVKLDFLDRSFNFNFCRNSRQVLLGNVLVKGLKLCNVDEKFLSDGGVI